MINTKNVLSSGFYIFESKVCQNNNYIETLAEGKMLLSYLNYYLKDYLKLYDYILTRHGIHFVVKIKESDEILRFQSIKNGRPTKHSISKIISEQVRLCLSTYVKRINKGRGRTGVLVHSSYLKYEFSNLKEAKAKLNQIRRALEHFYQKRKKYRSIKKHFNLSKNISGGSIFLCRKEIIKDHFKKKKQYASQPNIKLTSFVLGKFTSILKSKNEQHKKDPSKPDYSP